MLNFRRLIPFGLLVIALVSVAFLTRASAESSTMTDAQIARIKTNCISAKSSLNQLRVSDAYLRVNRGQMYESMTSKLMSRFNSRADNNNLNSKDLVSITNSYNTAFSTFSSNYQAYAEQLSLALAIDCQKEPVSFYDAVASSRTKRDQVHNNVIILHQYIDAYQVSFSAFVTNNQQKIGGSN